MLFKMMIYLNLLSHYCLLLIYMSKKQKMMYGVYFDEAGFGSKSRTLAEAREVGQQFYRP